MKRLRTLFESIVFAGLRPGDRPEQTRENPWLGRLRASIDRFLSGGAPKDPLYLTNRSLAQKLKAGALIAAPCLLAMGVAALALSGKYFDPPDRPAPKEMTAEEISRKILPNIGRNVRIDTNRDVEVVEAHLEHAAELKLTGSVRNNSARNFAAVDVVFNLTDTAGSQSRNVGHHF